MSVELHIKNLEDCSEISKSLKELEEELLSHLMDHVLKELMNRAKVVIIARAREDSDGETKH